MAGVNKVILIGHLGKNPDIRSTNTGDKVCQLSIATSESWKDKGSGEKKERTEWHRIAIFNQSLVETAEKYLKKGSKVYIEGQLSTRKYTDSQGVERYTTEVVLSNFKGTLVLLDGTQGSSPPPVSSMDDYGYNQPAAQSGDLCDEIPF